MALTTSACHLVPASPQDNS